jgi:hypothetical protein
MNKYKYEFIDSNIINIFENNSDYLKKNHNNIFELKNGIQYFHEDINGVQYTFGFNELHNEEGPAILKVDGQKLYLEHRINGKLHNCDEPALVHFDDNLYHIAYYKDNKLHCETGPAEIYNEYSVMYIEIWKINGIYHRENSPAFIVKTDLIDIPNMKKYYNYGVLHNINGPAWIEDFEDYSKEKYYLFGKQLPKNIWKKEVEKLKNQ